MSTYPGPVLEQDSTLTEIVLDHAQAWTDGQDDHANFLTACAAAFEQTYSIVTPFGDPEEPDQYWAPWAVLLDPTNCPTDLLPYLSQFNGTNVQPGTDDATARQQIVSEQAMNRGTFAAMLQAAKNNLTGDQYVLLIERVADSGEQDAYHVILNYHSSECPSAQALAQAVEAQKPAGIQVTYVTSDSPTWIETPGTWSQNTNSWSGAPVGSTPQPPTLVFSPTSGASLPAGTASLSVTFSTAMITTTGSVTLYDSTTGQTVSTGQWLTSTQVSFTNVVLAGGHSYEIVIPSGLQTLQGYTYPSPVSSFFTTSGATLTLSGMTASVNGSTVTVSVNYTPDITSLSLTQNGTAVSTSPTMSNGTASWTLNNVPNGTYTYVAVGYSSPTQQTAPASQTAIVGPSSSAVVLNPSPTGPAMPGSGWTVAFADTFTANKVDTNFWVPQRGTMAQINQNMLGDNPNNNEYFNASQCQVGADGLDLVCEYLPSGDVTSAGYAIDYLAGYMQTTTVQDKAGMAPTGFSLQIDQSTMWAFEIVCTLPPTTTPNTGADWNFWMTDPPWTIEFDFFEIWGWGNNSVFYSMTPSTWIYDTSNDSLIQQAYYSNSGPAMPAAVGDGLEHRWTWVFNPSTKRVQCYIDGLALGSGIAYPATWSPAYMGLRIESATRVNTTVTETRTMNVRSVAAYYRTGDAPLMRGGGLAAGTVVGTSGGGSSSNPGFSSISAFGAPPAANWLYGNGVTLSGGAITAPVSSAAVGFNTRGTLYSILDSSLSCELSLTGVGTGNRHISFGVGDQEYSSQNKLGWVWTDAAIFPFYTVAGTSTNGTSITTSGESVFVKISESNGTTTWSYSLDGTTWETAQSIADPLSSTILGAMYLNAGVEDYGSDPVVNATFSNLNTY